MDFRHSCGSRGGRCDSQLRAADALANSEWWRHLAGACAFALTVEKLPAGCRRYENLRQRLRLRTRCIILRAALAYRVPREEEKEKCTGHEITLRHCSR